VGTETLDGWRFGFLDVPYSREMLALYHHGSSACAAKTRFALDEKGLAWESRYVDILRGEQFSPEFRALNPKAVVPVLIHDGPSSGNRPSSASMSKRPSLTGRSIPAHHWSEPAFATGPRRSMKSSIPPVLR